MTADLALVVPADRAALSRFEVAASPPQLVAVAARLRIPAVAKLVCRFDTGPNERCQFAVSGFLQASVVLECGVSLERFDHKIEESFAIVFVPEAILARQDGEAGDGAPIDDLDSPDEIGFGPAGLALGDAAIEQLALALPPFPRKSGARLPGVVDAVDGEVARPMAELLKWRKNPTKPV